MNKQTVSSKKTEKQAPPVNAMPAEETTDRVLTDAAETIERALDIAKLKTHLAKMDINDLAHDAQIMFNAANRRFSRLRGDVAHVPAAILGVVGNGCLRLRDKIVH